MSKRFALVAPVVMLGLILMGAGCRAPKEVEDALEPSTWFLTVEGNTPWYAVVPYWKAGVKFGEVPARSTNFSESRVWLQNVDKPVRMEGYPYHEDWDYYQGDDWIVMDVNVFSDNAGGLPNDTAPTVYGDRTLGVRQSGVNTIYYWKDRHLFEILVYKGASANINDAFARLVEQM
ncbi:MAG: hypothetical protein AAB898_02070 [Patescibacteria group bacterium]